MWACLACRWRDRVAGDGEASACEHAARPEDAPEALAHERDERAGGSADVRPLGAGRKIDRMWNVRSDHAATGAGFVVGNTAKGRGKQVLVRTVRAALK